MTRVTIKDVKRLSEATGVIMTTWSPGDGVTRYRFVKATADMPDYFGSSGSDVLGTCLGAKEAYAWLQGYQACRRLMAPALTTVLNNYKLFVNPESDAIAGAVVDVAESALGTTGGQG